MVSYPIWAPDATVRAPTTAEQSLGFPCGALDLDLFNYLFRNIYDGLNAVRDADLVVSGYQSAPPGSPAQGARYVVKSAGSGAWAGQSNKLASYFGTAWIFTDVPTGTIVNYWDGSREIILFWTGVAWIDKAVAERAQSLNYRTAGGTANALTVTLDPVPANYTELLGAPLRVKIATTNTGAATLNVNGLGAKPIARIGSGAAMVAGDLVAGGIYSLVYDGTSFQVTGAGSNALQSGGSSAFAPQLLNIDATATANVSVPSTTNTLLQFQTTNNSNLGSSVWSGSRLTVGAGEAGLWYIQASWVFSTPSDNVFSTCRIRVNGTTIRGEAGPPLTQAGGGVVIQTQTILKLAAGDYVEALANHQSGSTQPAQADPRARFVGMLLSSY